MAEKVTCEKVGSLNEAGKVSILLMCPDLRIGMSIAETARMRNGQTAVVQPNPKEARFAKRCSPFT